jgi:CRISPR-associated protein Csb3
MAGTLPNISVNVDPTNPGQFFACCGLLELADRLWPGSEGWFAEDGEKFFVSINSTTELVGKKTRNDLLVLVKHFANCSIKSSLGDDGLRRLGTLLSQEKSSLTNVTTEEKMRLKAAWKREQIIIGPPFDLILDWWWDDLSGVTLLKTWAAKQFITEIIKPLHYATHSLADDETQVSALIQFSTKIRGLPFYFDSDNQVQNTPRDYGISFADVRTASVHRPFLELLAFIGLQRFRPRRIHGSNLIQYAIWFQPLAMSVASAVASGRIEIQQIMCLEFSMLYRTDYMKAFLPSTPLSRKLGIKKT